VTQTVSDVTPRTQYTASGGQTAFSVPFEFQANSDVVCYVNGALTTAYTLTGAGVSGGGTLTFTSGRTAGDIVTILRDMPINRDETRYVSYGPLPGVTLEEDFVAQTMRMQQLERDLTFAIRGALTESLSGSDFALPTVASRKGKFLKFSSSTGAVEVADVSTTVGAISQSIIGTLLYPQSSAEAAAGITPTNYQYAPGNVDRYGTYTNSSTDFSTAVQAAFTLSQSHVATFTPFRTYRCNSNLSIPGHGAQIEGNYCTLDLFGSGNNIDFATVAGVYNVGCKVRRLNVNVNTASATGIRARCSHSTFFDVYVTLKAAAANAAGWELKGDEASGTGPYYNTFINCSEQGQGSGQTGKAFTAIAPNYRGPNANTFIGGRAGQLATAWSICGSGNNIFGPTVEGCTTAFDHIAGAANKCVQNLISGYYSENNTTVFKYASGANYNGRQGGFITGVTTIVNDSGANNWALDSNSDWKTPNGKIDLREGSASYDPPNLAAGATTTTTVTVTGAALGDLAMAAFSSDLSGLTINADVSAANTVRVRLTNPTAGAIDLPAGTLYARAWKRA